jgi:hypothetical protein
MYADTLPSERPPLGRALRELGLGQAKFAGLVDYSHAHVQSVVVGRRVATLRFRKACVKALAELGHSRSEDDLFGL